MLMRVKVALQLTLSLLNSLRPDISQELYPGFNDDGYYSAPGGAYPVAGPCGLAVFSITLARCLADHAGDDGGRS